MSLLAPLPRFAGLHGFRSFHSWSFHSLHRLLLFGLHCFHSLCGLHCFHRLCALHCFHGFHRLCGTTNLDWDFGDDVTLVVTLLFLLHDTWMTLTFLNADVLNHFCKYYAIRQKCFAIRLSLWQLVTLLHFSLTSYKKFQKLIISQHND